MYEQEGVFIASEETFRLWIETKQLCLVQDPETSDVVATARILVTTDSSLIDTTLSQYRIPVSPSAAKSYRGENIDEFTHELTNTVTESTFKHEEGHDLFVHIGKIFIHPEQRQNGLSTSIIKFAVFDKLPFILDSIGLSSCPRLNLVFLRIHGPNLSNEKTDTTAARYISLFWYFTKIIKQNHRGSDENTEVSRITVRVKPLYLPDIKSWAHVFVTTFDLRKDVRRVNEGAQVRSKL
ncbi:hypothetical protein BKA69DRAFT_1091833 [Paraphysoderma sedebokerense]|nr:hypothetical protein BKA69DRAFT_1091833 [Paraphysoderma sedebokerense]